MNKKLLTFMVYVSALIMADTAYASKTYLPTLEIGKKWTYINYAVSGELHQPAVPWTWETISMTDEDGLHIFTLLYDDAVPDDSEIKYESTKNEYEKDGVLWSYSYEECEYMPMVDYNLEVGDMVDDWYEVIWKGPVIIEDVERCVIALRIPGAIKVNYWIEGIGAIDDIYLSPVVMHIGERSRMTECRMGDKCLFDYSRMDEYMSGIDLSGVKPLSDDEESAPIYDILGRRITEPTPGQLYIQSGKKHIAK
ncbi:MAG: hypothetical protein K2H38_05620 [Muribaculaceae bacterium]|nr:hypothetical protein [Muribaculaceae bacterium]MDE6551678.1 hypothetical protein [Muribaculaceae bacterium]